MKHYLSVEEHKEVSKKLKDIEDIFSILSPLINKFPKSSKVAKNFYQLRPSFDNKHFVELKGALVYCSPFVKLHLTVL